jgi:hypothetical protein
VRLNGVQEVPSSNLGSPIFWTTEVRTSIRPPRASARIEGRTISRVPCSPGASRLVGRDFPLRSEDRLGSLLPLHENRGKCLSCRCGISGLRRPWPRLGTGSDRVGGCAEATVGKRLDDSRPAAIACRREGGLGPVAAEPRRGGSLFWHRRGLDRKSRTDCPHRAVAEAPSVAAMTRGVECPEGARESPRIDCPRGPGWAFAQICVMGGFSLGWNQATNVSSRAASRSPMVSSVSSPILEMRKVLPFSFP